jgi:hypothetical protein
MAMSTFEGRRVQIACVLIGLVALGVAVTLMRRLVGGGDEAKEFRRRSKTEYHDLRSRHRQEMEELANRLKDEAGARRRGHKH